MDALRDLMAREMGKQEPRHAPAEPATVTPPRAAAKLEPRPDARPQSARREVKIDPVARATLDKLMAGEIARVEQTSPTPPVAAPAPAAPPPAVARPASAMLARAASTPPAAPRLAPVPVRTAAVPPRVAATAPSASLPRPSPAPVRVAPSVAQPMPATSRGQWSKLAWPTAERTPAPASTPAPAEPQPGPVVQAAPAQAEPSPEPVAADDMKPSPPPLLVALFEARAVPGGKGVFATKAIAKGTRLFGDDDWADDEERKSFSALSLQQFEELKPELRSVFLRYAYNTSLEQITGAFRPELVRDPINFINHSCDPNAGYDGAGNIVALRSIAADEEIRMDYGTFSFSFDHEFTCGCQALWCRGKVTAKDWPDLVRAGLRLPAFMHQETAKALWG